MDEIRKDKVERVLGIYTKLLNGDLVNKAQEAQNYGVNERSIQRDIEEIRKFLELDENSGYINRIVYDRIEKGFRLEQIYRMKLNNSEILAICKILLDSRAFTKAEMQSILDRLIDCCVPKANRKLVSDLIKNEEYHYVEPQHKVVFIDTMWRIGQAIRSANYIEIEYKRVKGNTTVKRRIIPLSIMFSEYYFYVVAFIDDKELKQYFDVVNDPYPTIYRIDRIKDITVLDEHYHIPYSSRFEEGEFRKRIQFMYGGKLQKVKFEYSGDSIEAVLDRLPTAKVIDESDGKYIIKAEVFGKGIDMWLRSQGNYVKRLE